MQDLYKRSGVRLRERWGMVWSEATKVGNQGQEGGGRVCTGCEIGKVEDEVRCRTAKLAKITCTGG
jgi:hypothetical protein